MGKKSLLVMIVVAIICLAIGAVGSYFITSKLLSNDNCTIQEKYEESENTVLSDDSYDSLFLSLDVKVSPEDLISSSNATLFAGDYIGAMYFEDISLEYKVVYSLYQYLEASYNGVDEYAYNTIAGDELGANFSISIDTVNKMIATFFADSEIGANFETSNPYYIVQSIKCDSKECNIAAYEGGGIGFQPSYNSKVISKDNNVYTVASYYVEIGDTGLDIYTKKNGELVKTVTFDVSSDDELNKIATSMYDYDTYVNDLGSKLMKYEYTFNDDNQLVSVEEA